MIFREKEVPLPKPVWNRLSDEEIGHVSERLRALGNEYAAAFYGAIFAARIVNPDDVALIGSILGDRSEKMGFSSRIAFTSFGDKKRRVLLPLRPIGLSVDLAYSRLDAILRNATDDLKSQKMPVVNSPENGLNVFEK